MPGRRPKPARQAGAPEAAGRKGRDRHHGAGGAGSVVHGGDVVAFVGGELSRAGPAQQGPGFLDVRRSSQQANAQGALHQRIDGGLVALGHKDPDALGFEKRRGEIGLVDVSETGDLDEAHTAKLARPVPSTRAPIV